VEAGLVRPADLDAALAEQRRSGRRLGQILIAHGAISAPQLTRALAEQHGITLDLGSSAEAATQVAAVEGSGAAPGPWQPLGRLLVARGTITEQQLEEGLAEQRDNGRRLGDILVDRGHVAAVELVGALIEQHGLERATEGITIVSAELSPEAEELDSRDRQAPPSEPFYEVMTMGERMTGQRALLQTDSFLDATDFAFEVLEAESPSRIEIVRVHGDKRELAWEYDADRAAEAAASQRDLTQMYGFDPLNWTGPPIKRSTRD
jgi:hypothetical protein